MTGEPKPPEFEQALDELERLVERLERGDLPLDEALRDFERGVALTRHCQGALETAQQRVEVLLRRGGRTEVQPFTVPEEDTGAPEAQPLGADPAIDPPTSAP